MAVARKSDVSATGRWFRKAIQNRRNRRSTSLRKQSTLQKISPRSVSVRSQVSVTLPVSVSEYFRPKETAVLHREVRRSASSGRNFKEGFPPATATALAPAVASSESLGVPLETYSFGEASYAQRRPKEKERRRNERHPSLARLRLELGLQQPSELREVTTEGSSLDTLPSIPVMPNSGAIPLWLLRLYAIHRHSSVVVFLLVTVTLMVYGWTVYSQQLWSQAYRHLQNLQHHERQLTTINGVLKEKMAQEAQRPAAGLVSPTPTRTIFLRRSPLSSNPISPNTAPNSEIQQQTANPVGY